MLLVNFVVAFALVLVVSNAAFLKKEAMNKRSDFVMKAKVPPSTPHEVIFAIKQKNLDVVEREVLERATPGNPKYQKWMTFSEVGKLIENPEAVSATVAWLESNGIQVNDKTTVTNIPPPCSLRSSHVYLAIKIFRACHFLFFVLSLFFFFCFVIFNLLPLL